MNREKKYFSFSFFVLMLITFLNITKVHAQLTLSGPTTAHYGDIFTYTLSENSGSEFWDFSWGADGTVLTDQRGHETEVEVYWDGNPGSNHLVYVFYKSNYYWNESYYEELSVNVASDPSVPEVPSISSLSCDEVVLQRSAPPGNSRVNNEDITWFWQSTPTGTSTANSNPTITLTSGTEYFLRARTNSGNQTWSTSSSSMQYQFKSGPPTVGNIVQPTVTTATGSVTLTGLPSDYWVINPGNITGSGTTKTITGLAAAATYNFTVTNSSGCPSNPSTSVVINVQSTEVPTPVVETIAQSSCTTATGSFSITNYNASYTYTANPSTGISFSGAVVTALPGNYSIKAAIGANSSPSSANITVNLQPTDCPLSNENYVHTISPLIAASNIGSLVSSQKQEAVTYFDGLGRPMQAIGIRGGGNNEDIITHITYDDYGRQDKEYLPYAEASNKGLFRTGNIDLATKNFYNTTKYENTTNPYSQKEFESSPLSRVQKQAAPGEDWKLGNGHEVKLDYLANTNEDQVRLFGVSFIAGNTENPSLTDDGIYAVPQLYKTITKDENWHASQSNLNEHTTQEFKDKQGRVILKRTYATVGAGTTIEKYDTYYVYDDFGNLTYVIPPKASDLISGNATNVQADATSTDVINSGNSLHISATNSITLLEEFNAKAGSTFSAVIVTGSENVLNDLCYQYKYDYRNRLIEKKLPGKEWEYIIYDKLDRPILIQDANLKANKKWLFTKYDVFGRPVYTGEYTNAEKTTRADVQLLANASTSIFETKQAANTINGTTVYYSNNAFPNINDTNINLFTINYYDDYSFDALPVTVPTPITNTKGLATGSKVRILGKTDWITNWSYYDAKGRLVYSYSKNDYLGTTSTIQTQLDFVGKVLQTTATHLRNNVTTTIVDAFTYDDTGRLTKQTQAINGAAPPEIIAANTYDELGQLTSKKVGGKTTQGLQTVDFKYNIRGWLKNINDVNAIGTDLFAFQINYNDIADVNKKLFNGNISQTFWKTANADTSIKNYTYSYDNLNRLTSAVDNLNKFSESLNYDKNGNITGLVRLGEIVSGVPLITNSTDFGTMDNLAYTYDGGNKLQIVSDSANDTYGFKDDLIGTGDDTTTDYTYDDNGNMKTDTNKGITGISYNHLNLPTQVTIGGQNINYEYDATGVKQQKTANGIVTDYAGGFIYEGSQLKFFSQPEGYVAYNSGAFDYIYQYKDHLGNVRLSYDKNLAIQEENNYYPFGLKQKGYNNVNNITTGNSTAQKYKYNGKELQDELNLNIYDYGARNYMPDIGRWGCIDNKSEKFISLSPYHYAGNNPVLYLDIDGNEFTEDAWKWVNRLIADINSRQASNNETIEEAKQTIASGKFGWFQSEKSLNNKIARLKNENTELETTRGETATLAASSQVYDVVTNSGGTERDAIGNSTTINQTTFNSNNNRVQLSTSSGTDLGLFSHELKHMYQFEMGETTLGLTKNNGGISFLGGNLLFYDLSDEVQAYQRGALFGQKENINSPADVLAKGLYNDKIPSGPINAVNHPNAAGIKQNPQSFSNKYNAAFRIGTTTYKPQ